MARSTLSFDFMAVAPSMNRRQPRAHAAPLWMWRATQSQFCEDMTHPPGSLSGRMSVGV
jgi:hypothetical protein